jgi:hypothetical protein
LRSELNIQQDPAMVSPEEIQQLYVAYFNRPADPAGLFYWQAQAARGIRKEVIAAEFSKSAEFSDAYAGLSSVEVVNKIYLNLFGRQAEPAGLEYWAGALESRSTPLDQIVTTIMLSAQHTDAVAVASKVEAAIAFTSALDTRDEISAYSGAWAASLVTDWLSDVTSPDSSKEAISKLASVVFTMVKGPPLPAPEHVPAPGPNIIIIGDAASYQGANDKTDHFFSTAEKLVGKTITGNAGNADTLTVTTAGQIIIDGSETGTNINDIKVLNLANGQNFLIYADAAGFTTINGGTGDDLLILDPLLLPATINGGDGYDNLVFLSDHGSGSDLNLDLSTGVTNIEAITAYGRGTASVINANGAGITLNYFASDGENAVTLGSGGQTLILESAATSHTTITGGSGADILNLVAAGPLTIVATGANMSNRTQLDEVINFDAETGTFKTGVNATTLTEYFIDDLDTSDYLALIEAELGGAFHEAAQAYIIEVEAGEAIGTYLFQNTGSDLGAFDDTDFFVKLVGNTDLITTANLIA